MATVETWFLPACRTPAMMAMERCDVLLRPVRSYVDGNSPAHAGHLSTRPDSKTRQSDLNRSGERDHRPNDLCRGCRAEGAPRRQRLRHDHAWNGAALTAAKPGENSSDQPPGDLACSGGGNRNWLILRRVDCCSALNPKADSQIWSPDELNSCVFKCLSNLLHGVKVGFDTTFRAFQPAYGRKRQPGFPGKLTLPPSQEGASCLDLSRVNQHLRPQVTDLNFNGPSRTISSERTSRCFVFGSSRSSQSRSIASRRSKAARVAGVFVSRGGPARFLLTLAGSKRLGSSIISGSTSLLFESLTCQSARAAARGCGGAGHTHRRWSPRRDGVSCSENLTMDSMSGPQIRPKAQRLVPVDRMLKNVNNQSVTSSMN